MTNKFWHGVAIGVNAFFAAINFIFAQQAGNPFKVIHYGVTIICMWAVVVNILRYLEADDSGKSE